MAKRLTTTIEDETVRTPETIELDRRPFVPGVTESRVIDGIGLVARFQSHCPSWTRWEKTWFTATTVQPIDASGEPIGEPVAVGPTGSPLHAWRSFRDGLCLSVLATATPREILLARVAELRATGSVLNGAEADQLEAQANALPDAKPPGFDVGPVTTTRFAHSASGGKLGAYLARHRTGDFGMYGLLADAVDSEAARWAPEAFGWTTRNAATIKAGDGLIVSRYRLDVGQSFNSKAPGHGGPSGGDLHVVTYLAGGKPVGTTIGCSHDSPTLPR